MQGHHKKEAEGSLDDLSSLFEGQAGFEKALKDLMTRMTVQNIPPQQAMGIDPQAMESLYSQAYRLYNTGKYSEALHIFRMLIIMNSTEPKYMMGLAACLHMMKEYKNAIETYSLCSMMDPNDPLPYYHQSDCCIQTKDWPSAALCLQMTIDAAGDKPEFAKVKERALLSLEGLKNSASAEE